ncbi:MAG TPA: 50S ribosomal protein L9 [Candidatus Paceibacterota bacterium]|nr:50S ribosomal protein L9 [Candidatus Paceibacterota bacterium]
MKVVLIKDVGGVGVRGAVKDVADGYALNFLIPRGLAEQATAQKVASVEAQVKAAAASLAAKNTEYEALGRRLDGASITIEAKANEKGHLYKQISAQALVDALKNQQGINVSTESIHFEKAIKEVGTSDVIVKLGTHSIHLSVTTKAS